MFFISVGHLWLFDTFPALLTVSQESAVFEEPAFEEPSFDVPL